MQQVRAKQFDGPGGGSLRQFRRRSPPRLDIAIQNNHARAGLLKAPGNGFANPVGCTADKRNSIFQRFVTDTICGHAGPP